jgi:hypothetical protein
MKVLQRTFSQITVLEIMPCKGSGFLIDKVLDLCEGLKK